MKFPKKLHKKLEDRKIDNSYRELYDQPKFIDFSSNDYLGFARNKNIFNKVDQYLKTIDPVNGSTGSRLISGNHLFHKEVELELANFFNTPASLLFNSGYDANIGLLSSVPQRGDLILFDELCHASIRDGIRLSRAKSFSFKHNDLRDLEKKFKNNQNTVGDTYVVVESIYSMDGDQAPLNSLVEFCELNQHYLIVDEAHSTGVFGNTGGGLVQELKLENNVFARVHTFGKAMGCHGAVVVGAMELRNYLINYARTFIYTTAMPLHNILSIKYAFEELSETKELLKLKENIRAFNEGIKLNKLGSIFIPSESAIHGCIIANNTKVKEIAKQLLQYEFDIKAILYPTVPKGKERLRFCIHSYNSSKQIKDVLKLLSTFT